MLVSFFVYLFVGLLMCFFVAAAALGLLVLLWAVGLPVAGIFKIFSKKG